ncbi:7-deoxyloganetin glucosyltransferase-like [Cynara cardunculus var. scolymus]|uniref:Glycosyltransferase n=1 Tax=Cynara cardunculus var. scolymus TaxID=59895 RepID=A0A103Y7T5_CYNCS|nr:7-deoxyloganetin glucosyltransferase-like [Cynara cardunculus var. scolymus]KVI04107.1 UDP-glucuronosyl/UDP-glucosyltransferase [Cynara cardunculus var. scolymus]
MGSKHKKPHVLCVPAPAQGHINPMLKLAKILHSKGFHITFVNTEFNHQRLVRSQDSDVLRGLPSFCFETIPDGLPIPENLDASQQVAALCKAIDENFLGPFRSLLTKLMSGSDSPVTYVVADVIMGFTLEAAKEMDIPEMLFWTSGAGSLLCYEQYPNLLDKGLMPITDSSFLVNGYLDTIYDCIPSMSAIRLKDIPPYIRITNAGDEYMVEFLCRQVERMKTASTIVLNTYDELESDIMDTVSSIFPPSYGIGPLNLLEKEIVHGSLASIKSNLWKEDTECLKWLDSKAPMSVIYVNFGSIAVMTPQQQVEFCWGLVKSGYSFLWIIRPDLVVGESTMLPPDLLAETKSKGLLASWCPQEQVLKHRSIGGYLTHSGWNSTIESISSGVPMICWPFCGDQQTNCWLCCNKWGVAMEIDNDVKSDEVAKVVIELMNGEKGKEMRKNAIDWKNKAEEACAFPYGSSMVNMDKLIHMLQTSTK